MSENLRNFVQAIYTFDAVVRRTAEDRLDAATPCESWNVTELIAHQCAVLNGVAAVASTGAMAKPTPPEDMSDVQTAWTATRDGVLAALDQDGVLQQQGPFWFEAPTVDDMIGIVMWDCLGHSWDLAQATGQDHCIPENLAEAAIRVIAPMSDMLVETGRTGPVVQVPDSAPVVDRYLGLIGRTPS